MTTAAHTAGEWYVTGKRDINGKYLHIGCKGSMMVLASLNPVHVDTEANARLIAAAPWLLEALLRVMSLACPLTGNPSHETLVGFWEYEKTQGRGEADDRLFALAAIAKATGAAA